MKPSLILLLISLSPNLNLSALTVTHPTDPNEQRRDGYVSNDSVPIPVQNGFWWNPAEPGSGFSIDIQKQFGFVAWYTYDASGNAVFYTVQGITERPTELERRASGVAVRLRGSILRNQGGNPPNQAWRPSQPGSSGLGEAEFVFFDSRRGEVRLANRVSAIQPFTPGGKSESSLLVGRWALTWRFFAGEVSRVQVEITAAPNLPPYRNPGFTGTSDPGDPTRCHGAQTGALPAADMPPSDVIRYEMRCLEGCTDRSSTPPLIGLNSQNATVFFETSREISIHVPNWTFWYSPSERRFGRLAISGRGNPGVTNCSDPADLFVTQDLIVARGRRARAFAQNLIAPQHTEFVLSRMPDESFDRYKTLAE